MNGRNRLCTILVLLLVAAPTATAHVNLQVPDGGERMEAGGTFLIVWNVHIQHFTLGWDLEYSVGGGPYQTIVTGLPPGDVTAGAVHSYLWTVPNIDSDQVRVRVKQVGQAHLIDEMEGLQVKLVTPKSEDKLEIIEVRPAGTDGYQIFYRSLVTYMSPETGAKLDYVAAVSASRGLPEIQARIARLLSFDSEEEDEDEDTEGIGPGYPGTDPRIVTYVKAPQTQESVGDPEAFPRTLPLHRRT